MPLAFTQEDFLVFVSFCACVVYSCMHVCVLNGDFNTISMLGNDI